MLRVVVPALNESENLAVVIPAIMEQVKLLDREGGVLVVDDGSTDDTVQTVEALQAQDPKIELLSLGRNLGKAAALRQGFDQVLASGATSVAMMDADGQDDPAELPRLAAALDAGSDLVTGARLVRRDRFVKRTTSRLYNRTTAWLSGAPGRDFNSGFKLMRAQVARQVSPMLYGELHRYLTVMAHWMGFKVTEVTVEHHPRLHGHSKYGVARFWRGFMDLLTMRFLMSYENRPSHLFGGLGGLSLLVGMGILLYLTVLKIGERRSEDGHS